MKKEDIEFLKDLQHKLKTQEDDGNASPVFWGVIEEKSRLVPDGYGDESFIVSGDTKYTVEEFVEIIEFEIQSIFYETERAEKLLMWGEINHDSIDDIVEFYNDILNPTQKVDVFDFVKEDVLSIETGAFLTKSACKEYIEKYGYNHSKPRTFAMTAYRNFELDRLLDILKNLNLDNIKVDNE